MLALLAVPLATAAAGSACRPDFAPYNRLVELRVLGMKSEPATPVMGKTGTWSALVHTPPGFGEPAYSWSWCPFPGPANGGHRCLITEEDIATNFPALAGQVPAFYLGTGPTADLTNVFDPQLLDMLCKGTAGLPPIANCTNGFPFQVALTVTATDSDGNEAHVDTVVTGHWPLPDTELNVNPTVDRLTAAPANRPGDDPEDITDVPPPTPLPRVVATPIMAVVASTAAESYRGRNDDGVLDDLRERLFLTWFVETGITDESRTSFTPPADSAEEEGRFVDLQKNSWTPGTAKDYPRDTARLYVVIHDNRGGMDWRTGTVNLEAAQ
jgi:hypothetical protein